MVPQVKWDKCIENNYKEESTWEPATSIPQDWIDDFLGIASSGRSQQTAKKKTPAKKTPTKAVPAKERSKSLKAVMQSFRCEEVCYPYVITVLKEYQECRYTCIVMYDKDRFRRMGLESHERFARQSTMRLGLGF